MSKANKYELQFARTTQNKIRKIEKALRTAGGRAIEQLNTRLAFWKAGKKVKKVERRWI